MSLTGKKVIKIQEIKFRNNILNIKESTSSIDDEWDSFLARSSYGQLEQTSLWAEAKKPSGWRPYRIVFRRDEEIIGGFQILWQQKAGVLKLGLLMKGPVVETDDSLVLNAVIDCLKMVVKKKFTALLVQTPDKDTRLTSRLLSSGFLPNRLSGIIKSANVVINLCQDEEHLLKSLKRQKRQNIRIAREAGITVRQGEYRELPIFFDLMRTTCQRRGVAPNPPTAEICEILWKVFSPKNQIKLFLAEFQGEIISAVLVLTLGHHASLWKFGWSGKFGQYRPNELLFWEIFNWARIQGYLTADLGPFGSFAADGLTAVTDLGSPEESSDVRFKTGFGGEIIKLQPGLLYIPNSVYRLIYNSLFPHLLSIPAFQKYISRML